MIWVKGKCDNHKEGDDTYQNEGEKLENAFEISNLCERIWEKSGVWFVVEMSEVSEMKREGESLSALWTWERL